MMFTLKTYRVREAPRACSSRLGFEVFGPRLLEAHLQIHRAHILKAVQTTTRV